MSAALVAATITLGFWIGCPVLLVGWLILVTRREERCAQHERDRVWREFDRAREAAWLDWTLDMPSAPNPRWRVGS